MSNFCCESIIDLKSAPSPWRSILCFAWDRNWFEVSPSSYIQLASIGVLKNGRQAENVGAALSTRRTRNSACSSAFLNARRLLRSACTITFCALFESSPKIWFIDCIYFFAFLLPGWSNSFCAVGRQLDLRRMQIFVVRLQSTNRFSSTKILYVLSG